AVQVELELDSRFAGSPSDARRPPSWLVTAWAHRCFCFLFAAVNACSRRLALLTRFGWRWSVVHGLTRFFSQGKHALRHFNLPRGALSEDSAQTGEKLVDVLFGAYRNPQAVAVAFVRHVPHQDPPLLERFVDGFDRPVVATHPNEIGLARRHDKAE